MVKDYFQDIMPPSDSSDSGTHQVPIHVDDEQDALRGIRSIPAPVRQRPVRRPESYEMPDEGSELPVRRLSRLWIWAVAALVLLVVSAFFLLAFRSTTVTVTPKSRPILLSETVLFSAYPEASAGTMLPYSVESSDLEDSEVVASQGVVRVEKKASGSITVFNEYSPTSVRLIKNTRFETPDGLVFRVPADVVVPGKTASGPGQVKITVIADQAGVKYNTGPVSRFTLPGLKSGDMYSKVYAKSTSPMTGGFVGDEPGMAPGALNAAIAAVRSRLETKARESLETLKTSDTIPLSDLMQITYETLPSTEEAGSGVRIHEKANILIPIIQADALAFVVAQSAAADSDTKAISIIPGDGFAVKMSSTEAFSLGVDTLKFVLTGKATLVWKVDAAALGSALAGREGSAFQTIVNGFSGIQEAHAKIEPFWKKSFPTEASDINIVIAKP